MRKPHVVTALLSVATVAVAACGTPTTVCGCSPVSRWFAVYGTVSDSSGPVADVDVRILAIRQADTVVAWEQDATDVAGRYRIDFPEDYYGETWAVRAEPNPALGLAPAAVAFVPRFLNGPERDSVRVDILLEEQPAGQPRRER